MKRDISSIIIVLLVLITVVAIGIYAIFAIFNKVPEEYIEGIEYNEKFPSDIIPVYKDAVVYRNDANKGEITLNAGSADSIDDIRDFYDEFFNSNGIERLSYEYDAESYSVDFSIDDYLFIITVEASYGRYVEDLYQSVITYSAKMMTEKKISELYPTQKPKTAPTVAPTPKPSPTASPIPTPEVKYLEIDSYTSWWSTHDEYNEVDFHFTITGESTGIMYQFNSITMEMAKKEFDYSYIEDILTFFFKDGTQEKYYIDLDDGTDITLINYDDVGLAYNITRYSDTVDTKFSSFKFTAFGCWYLYDTQNDYLETLSLWENGEGMYYNSDMEEYQSFEYSYSNHFLTLTFDDHTTRYTMKQKGNVIELLNKDTDTETFMFRVDETMLKDEFQFKSSSGGEVIKFNLLIRDNNFSNFTYDDGKTVISEEKSYWAISNNNGNLELFSSDDSDSYFLEYHYFLVDDGLYILQEDYSDMYFLEKVR